MSPNLKTALASIVAAIIAVAATLGLTPAPAVVECPVCPVCPALPAEVP